MNRGPGVFKTEMTIIPLLLAGGAGTRLWPVSRDDLNASHGGWLVEREDMVLTERSADCGLPAPRRYQAVQLEVAGGQSSRQLHRPAATLRDPDQARSRSILSSSDLWHSR